MNLTFITGNQNKADYLAKWLGRPVGHRKLDLDEIQSLNLRQVVAHKVRQAFEVTQSPVLVEDVAMELAALGGLPGPFIKFFEVMGLETMCRMLDSFDDRAATCKVVYGWYDGAQTHFFEGQMHGTIAKTPRGSGGFGFDSIFINAGQPQTRAEMSEATYAKTSYRTEAIAKLAKFLQS